jgi:predicted PurR-regulated permease PerM
MSEANGPQKRFPSHSMSEQSRQRFRQGTIVGLTLVGLLLCTLLAYPFLPALAWAVALTIMVFPIHGWLANRIPNANLAAGLSTALVIAIFVIPILFIGQQLGHETAHATAKAKELTEEGKVEATVARIPRGSETMDWVKRNVDLEGEARQLLAQVTSNATLIARGSTWFAIQTLVCVFVIFFAFRDWHHLLQSTESLSPLTRTETEYLFTRVSDSIHATVYATVVTSLVQGISGGLLFWALGLPAPLLWAVVMIILGIIPLVGAVLVWLPAAILLATEDRWGAAIVLVTWGSLMAGPIGNWLYAYLAGGRLRLHPVPVLLSFVGGLVVFGVSGMVIGPVILAVTMGLLDVWKMRFGTAEAETRESIANANSQPERIAELAG